jgi:hypothetical protein
MSQGIDTLKMVPLALPADCPPSQDPLFKVSEGRPPRSNRTRDGEAVKKSKDFQSGQGDVGKTVERLPFSGLIIRIENHVRLTA